MLEQEAQAGAALRRLGADLLQQEDRAGGLSLLTGGGPSPLGLPASASLAGVRPQDPLPAQPMAIDDLLASMDSACAAAFSPRRPPPAAATTQPVGSDLFLLQQEGSLRGQPAAGFALAGSSGAAPQFPAMRGPHVAGPWPAAAAAPPPQVRSSLMSTVPSWVREAVSSLPEPVPGFRQVEVTLVALVPTFCPGHLARSLTASNTSETAADLALALLQRGFFEMVREQWWDRKRGMHGYPIAMQGGTCTDTP
jgi:hypothetical protein